MGKLRIGVTGLGRIGWEHCRALAGHADFTLAAVADPLGERLAEAATNFGCTTCKSHDELLTTDALDAVVIASPTHLHREMSLAAFAAKRHVLLEKPMATTVSDAHAVAAAGARAQRVLTVYQPHRLMAYHQQTRQAIASGRLGQVYHVRRAVFGWVRRND